MIFQIPFFGAKQKRIHIWEGSSLSVQDNKKKVFGGSQPFKALSQQTQNNEREPKS